MNPGYRLLPLSAPSGCEASTAVLLADASGAGRFKTRLHFIYCHAGLLKANKGDAVLTPLKAMAGAGQEIRDWDKHDWQPKINSIVVLDTISAKDLPKLVVTAFGKLRIALYDEEIFNVNPAVVLCHPVIQDLRDYPDLISYVDSESYCLWDDGGLWQAAAWQGNKVALAWRGSGWAQDCVGTDLILSSTLENRFKRSLDDLDLYGRGLLDYVVKHESERLPKLARKPGDSYMTALLEFLPGYWVDATKRSDPPFPCHSPGGCGQPIPWPGIAALHQHLRHLFLDGWLTLWPVGDELYLQPASLALLYWAARWADKPYADTPKKFIKHHDWQSGNWFGGHWKGKQS